MPFDRTLTAIDWEACERFIVGARQELAAAIQEFQKNNPGWRVRARIPTARQINVTFEPGGSSTESDNQMIAEQFLNEFVKNRNLVYFSKPSNEQKPFPPYELMIKDYQSFRNPGQAVYRFTKRKT